MGWVGVGLLRLRLPTGIGSFIHLAGIRRRGQNLYSDSTNHSFMNSAHSLSAKRERERERERESVKTRENNL